MIEGFVGIKGDGGVHFKGAFQNWNMRAKKETEKDVE